MKRSAFELQIAAEAGNEFVPFLLRHLSRARSLLQAPLRELSLVLVGDKRMSDLHHQFMNIKGPTDVLTFPIDTDPRGRAISGEVILCVPEARRAAKIHGTDVKNELLLYAIHGMLHLCGFDDRTESAFRKMHAKEDQILIRLGVGRVFDPAPRRSALKQRPRTSRPAKRDRTGAR